LTNGSHQIGAVAWTAKVDIRSFTTDFNFIVPNPQGFGLFFYVQNVNTTTNPVAGGSPPIGAPFAASANGMGYGAFGLTVANPVQHPIGNSIGVKFDGSNFNGENNVVAAGQLSGTGLHVDGGPNLSANAPESGTTTSLAPQVDLVPAGIIIGGGNAMNVNLVYDGTLLTLKITDAVTLATTRISWPVNIPAIVGANTAWVGLCSGTNQETLNFLNSWSFSSGINTRLATPTMTPTPGQFTGAQTVTLSGPVGATIYYTIDGSPPTINSLVYSAPFAVSVNTLVQAVAVQAGFTDSLVASGNYLIQAAATPIINFPAGFASGNAAGLIQTTGRRARFSGANLILTDTTFTSETAGAWYRTPVPISTFDFTFGLSLTSVGANGCAFVIQNYPQTDTGTNLNLNLGAPYLGTVQVTGGPFMQSCNATDLGYTGIINSCAIIFDYFNGSGNLTGLYTNGRRPTGSSIDMTGSGVSLHAAGAITVRLQYDGTTLTQTVTQGGNVFSHNYTVDIQSLVGSSRAFVGFTAGTGGSTCNAAVTKWTGP
jgi:hypothetical protein